MSDNRKRFKTAYQGVRYRESQIRKHGSQADRYFIIRTYHDGKEREEGLGWASEGWTAKKASEVLAGLKKAQTIGKGPQTLAESREQVKAGRAEQAKRQQAEAVAAMLFCRAALDYYLPWSRRNKVSWPDDVGRFEMHLCPAFGSVPIRELAREHVEAMLEAMVNKGLAPATQQQCLALTRRICNYCSVLTIRGEPLFPGRNPCSGVVVRGPDNGRLRFLSHLEADELLEAAATFGRDSAMHDIIVLAINTGMRLGEITHPVVQGSQPDQGPVELFGVLAVAFEVALHCDLAMDFNVAAAGRTRGRTVLRGVAAGAAVVLLDAARLDRLVAIGT